MVLGNHEGVARNATISDVACDSAGQAILHEFLTFANNYLEP